MSFRGIQAKARDAQRLQYASSIVKALDLYKIQNGVYPDPVSTTGAGGWELTTNGSAPTDFLAALRSPAQGVSRVPLDPKNTVTGGLDPNVGANNHVHFYYKYGPGTAGCDATKGEFYVFSIQRMETVINGNRHPASPGFACGNDWGNMGAWVTGAYTKVAVYLLISSLRK